MRAPPAFERVPPVAPSVQDTGSAVLVIQRSTSVHCTTQNESRGGQLSHAAGAGTLQWTRRVRAESSSSSLMGFYGTVAVGVRGPSADAGKGRSGVRVRDVGS